MTDAEYEREKARINALIPKWQKPLGLGWWKITHSFSRTPLVSNNAAAVADNWKAVAQTVVQWQYLLATVRWNMIELVENEFSDADLEAIFVHELMHVFLHETRQARDADDWLDHEERVATHLANAFIWLRDSLTEEKAKSEEIQNQDAPCDWKLKHPNSPDETCSFPTGHDGPHSFYVEEA